MSIRKLASGVALAALITSPALAADLDRSYKDVPSDYAQSAGMVNWSGFYIGGAIGYGNSSHNLSVNEFFKDYCDQNGTTDTTPFSDDDKDETSASDISGCTGGTRKVVSGDSRELAHLDGVNASGLVGDVRLGYDHARGRYLFGVYGTYGFNNMEADAAIFGDFATASIEKQDEWFVGARAGYLVAPRTLAYVLAGYSQTDYDFTGSFGGKSATKSVTFDGITVGGGLEFALAGNLFLGLEATHTFYGEETVAEAYSVSKNEGVNLKDDLDETKVMGTLKIKLNNGLFD